MGLLTKLKPDFWDHEDVAAGATKQRFSLRRLWQTLVLAAVALLVTLLLVMTLMDLKLNRQAAEAEISAGTIRMVSTAGRRVAAFFSEHRQALDYVVHDNEPAALQNPARLKAIADHLRQSGYGFADLRLMDGKDIWPVSAGTAAGGDNRAGASGTSRPGEDRQPHISGVFIGPGQALQLKMAVPSARSQGDMLALSAVIDLHGIERLLEEGDRGGAADIFLVDRQGLIQTPSRRHGGVLQKVRLPLPDVSDGPGAFEVRDGEGSALSVGYGGISDTPFILMVVRPKDELLRPWMRIHQGRLAVFSGIILMLLLLSVGGATYLVSRLHLSDHRRVVTLHEVEYAHKMASLGRLSAGVAHEINNPLAVINEKAGLIKDLFTIGRRYAEDAKLMGLVESILASVDRCARVTRRLLNFARHVDINPQQLHFGEVIHEVFSFLGKDAEYRDIRVVLDVPPDIPPIVSDRGRIQEIFLNLLNNSFAAMSDGGRLEIAVRPKPPDFIEVTVADDGRGIPQADLKRIFEPFFSARVKGGGTGLGLSITYGLVKEIGGTVCVDSEVGKGTRFTVELPLNFKDGRPKSEGAFCRW